MISVSDTALASFKEGWSEALHGESLLPANRLPAPDATATPDDTTIATDGVRLAAEIEVIREELRGQEAMLSSLDATILDFEKQIVALSQSQHAEPVAFRTDVDALSESAADLVHLNSSLALSRGVGASL